MATTDITPAISQDVVLSGLSVRSKYTPIKVRESADGGTQFLFKFPNDYGASIVAGGFMAYGGLEAAVIHYEYDADGGIVHFSLEYDTPITDDVLGYLDPFELEGILDQINALPPKSKALES